MAHSKLQVVAAVEEEAQLMFDDLDLGDFFYVNNLLERFGICRKISADRRQNQDGKTELTPAGTFVVPVDVRLTWRRAEV